MPERRLQRTRGTLPLGYQYGEFVTFKGIKLFPRNAIGWRAPQENAAERLARYQQEYETGSDEDVPVAPI